MSEQLNKVLKRLVYYFGKYGIPGGNITFDHGKYGNFGIEVLVGSVLKKPELIDIFALRSERAGESAFKVNSVYDGLKVKACAYRGNGTDILESDPQKGLCALSRRPADKGSYGTTHIQISKGSFAFPETSPSSPQPA